MEIVKAYFELDAATRQKIFEAFERIIITCHVKKVKKNFEKDLTNNVTRCII